MFQKFKSESDGFLEAIEEIFIKLENKTEDTDLNEEDKMNLYFIKTNNLQEKEKKNQINKIKITNLNEKKNYQPIPDIIPDSNPISKLEELQDNFFFPQSNNKLSQKQPETQMNKNFENSYISKKTTRSNTDNIKKPKFINRKNGRISEIESIPQRKIHDKFTKDNVTNKIMRFIFNILIIFFNQLLDSLFDGNQYHLHKYVKEVCKGNVDFNKKLMTSQLKTILNLISDNYDENLLNNLCENQIIIKTFLELKFEDIFNYLRMKKENETTEANNIFKIKEVQDEIKIAFLDDLNFYSFYKNELDKKKEKNKIIIEDNIKNDFVKLTNNRVSKSEKMNKKIRKKGKKKKIKINNSSKKFLE